MNKDEAIKQLSIIYLGEYDKDREAKNMAISALKGGWIPIVIRPLTKEEEAENDGIGYCEGSKYMYDCEMPEDGQEVLVSTPWGVATDTFYHDDGWYFENYCDDGDVLAWQPLPEPYKKPERI